MKYLESVNQNFHLQGFTTDNKHMYWSFTDSLVMTTMSGTVIRQVPVATYWEHLGGIDYIDGKIYGAAMSRNPNNSSIHIYDAETLATINIIQLKDCIREADTAEDGFNGIGCISEGYDPADGEKSLFIGAAFSSNSHLPGQYIFSYTFEGKRKNRYFIPTGPTLLGMQNIDRDPTSGCYYITTYGAHTAEQNPNMLYKISPDLKTVLEEYTYTSAYGIHCLGNDMFYLSLQSGTNGHRNGYAYEVSIDFIKKVAPKNFSEDGMNEYIMPLFDESMGL